MTGTLKLSNPPPQIIHGRPRRLIPEHVPRLSLRDRGPRIRSIDDPAERIEPAEIIGGVVGHVRTLPSRSDTAMARSGPPSRRTPLRRMLDP